MRPWVSQSARATDARYPSLPASVARSCRRTSRPGRGEPGQRDVRLPDVDAPYANRRTGSRDEHETAAPAYPRHEASERDVEEDPQRDEGKSGQKERRRCRTNAVGKGAHPYETTYGQEEEPCEERDARIAHFSHDAR